MIATLRLFNKINPKIETGIMFNSLDAERGAYEYYLTVFVKETSKKFETFENEELQQHFNIFHNHPEKNNYAFRNEFFENSREMEKICNDIFLRSYDEFCANPEKIAVKNISIEHDIFNFKYFEDSKRKIAKNCGFWPSWIWRDKTYDYRYHLSRLRRSF